MNGPGDLWFLQARANGAGRLGNSLYHSDTRVSNPSQIGLYPKKLRPSENISPFAFQAVFMRFISDVGTIGAKPITVGNYIYQPTRPFIGAGVALFDGSGDYIRESPPVSALIHAGDFTYEFYFRSNTFAAEQAVLGSYDTSHYETFISIVSANQINTIWNNVIVNATGLTLVAQEWYHVACVRSGTTLTIYVGGVAKSTGTVSGSVGIDASIYIGCDAYNTTLKNFNGGLSELRISNTAVYTADFTPPVARFSGTNSNTKLLYHFRGAGSSFTDSAPVPGNVYNNGSVRQLPLDPWGTEGTVGFFSYTAGSPYVYLDDSDEWAMFDSDFTIETRFQLSSTTQPMICGQYIDSTTFWGFYVSYLNRLYLVGSLSSTYVFSYYIPVSFTPNVWYHVAAVRSGSNWYMFVNGTMTVCTTETAYTSNINLAAPLTIGATYGGGTLHPGYLSDFKISSVARYTSSFTLPNTRATADANTKLLLPMNGTNATFTDESTSYNRWYSSSKVFFKTSEWAPFSQAKAVYVLIDGKWQESWK